MLTRLGMLVAVATIATGCSGGSDARGASGSDGAAPPATGGAPGSGGNGGASPAGGGRTSGGGSPGTGGAPAAGGSTSSPGATVTYGTAYTGGLYHLGPVDYDETQFHNACAPGTKYAAGVRAAEGNLLAGLWGGIPDVSGYCDACILVKTAKGKSAVLRVVTYGATTTNSIDVSPEAFSLLNVGENPRDMTWQLAECPATGPVMYEFQTGSSEWWTSFWLRNARVPVAKVEVQSANHAQWTELQRGSDGTLTDGAGFGQGPFSIRTTGIDSSQITDTFQWPSAGIAGQMLSGAGNFP